MQTAVLESRNTAAKPAQKKRGTPLDPKAANQLLDLLASDTAFRRLFKKDPAAALAQIGSELQSKEGNSIFGCMGVTRLASKTEIAAARSALLGYLTSSLSQTVVFSLGGRQRQVQSPPEIVARFCALHRRARESRMRCNALRLLTLLTPRIEPAAHASFPQCRCLVFLGD